MKHAFGLVDRDRITHPDRAIGKYFCIQTRSMQESGGEPVTTRQLFEMPAWLTELDASEANLSDTEFSSDQVIECDALRQDVAARHRRVNDHVLISPDGLDGFTLDECHLARRADLIRKSTAAFAVPVTGQTSRFDCLNRGNRLKGAGRLCGDEQRNNTRRGQRHELIRLISYGFNTFGYGWNLSEARRRCRRYCRPEWY